MAADSAQAPGAEQVAVVSALVSRTLAQFEEPARRQSLRRRSWRVGPWRIEQRHLGSSLEDLFYPAWAHLPDGGDGPEGLTVYCVDVQATGFDLGRLPWRAADAINQGMIAGLEGSDYRACWDKLGHAVHLFDRRRKIGIYAVRSRRDFRGWERSIPLRHILHWWSVAQGGQLMHAGAVGSVTGGVLLLGPSGAGKSTTTLACLAGGLSIASDDFVLIDLLANPVMIHSVSSTAKLSHAALLRFPELAARVANPAEAEPEKAIFFLDHFAPSSLIAAMPLKAFVVLNQRPGHDSALERVSAATALQACAPNTLFLLPGERAPGFVQIAALFRRFPCFRLDLGYELSQIPQRLRDLLGKL
jgi:hypothetical protein